jgi:hypothetical protein
LSIVPASPSATGGPSLTTSLSFLDAEAAASSSQPHGPHPPAGHSQFPPQDWDLDELDRLVYGKSHQGSPSQAEPQHSDDQLGNKMKKMYILK